jgi:hypothetical protein
MLELSKESNCIQALAYRGAGVLCPVAQTIFQPVTTDPPP